jgi:hypothetical protein
MVQDCYKQSNTTLGASIGAKTENTQKKIQGKSKKKGGTYCVLAVESWKEGARLLQRIRSLSGDCREDALQRGYSSAFMLELVEFEIQKSDSSCLLFLLDYALFTIRGSVELVTGRLWMPERKQMLDDCWRKRWVSFSFRREKLES